MRCLLASFIIPMPALLLIIHAGRHTYASEICLSQGVPIETVSRMLGHRDLRSTQIYAKISNNKISEDTDRLEERIKDKFRLTGIEQEINHSK